MIKGVHALFHTTDADAARAFIRDKLRLPYHDAGDGWLIFDAPGQAAAKELAISSSSLTKLAGSVADTTRITRSTPASW